MFQKLASLCHLCIILNVILFLTQFVNADPLKDQCDKTPFWKLNICPIDCVKCSTNAKCSSCPEDFQLITDKCIPIASAVFQNIFFTDPQIKYSSDNMTIVPKNFSTLNQYLTMNNTVRLCVKDSYKFDMLGLFNQKNHLSFSLQQQTPVTGISIKFNFLTLFPNTSIDVILNGRQIYTTIIKGQNISKTYEPSSDAQKQNYLSITALKQSSTSVFINKVQTGIAELEGSQYRSKLSLQLQVSYKANASNIQPFWAVSDISIISTKCQNCVSDRVIQLGQKVGIAIGITTAVLLFLVAILYACVKYEEKQRLLSFQSKSSEQTLTNDDQKLDSREQNQRLRETVISQKNKSKNN